MHLCYCAMVAHMQNLSRDGRCLETYGVLNRKISIICHVISLYKPKHVMIEQCPLRKLRKSMERYMPDVAVIQEDQELCPGGDIRTKGNSWLRTAWQKCQAKRVPRESEFRKLVGIIAERHSLCILVESFSCNVLCGFSCNTSERKKTM